MILYSSSKAKAKRFIPKPHCNANTEHQKYWCFTAKTSTSIPDQNHQHTHKPHLPYSHSDPQRAILLCHTTSGEQRRQCALSHAHFVRVKCTRRFGTAGAESISDVLCEMYTARDAAQKKPKHYFTSGYDEKIVAYIVISSCVYTIMWVLCIIWIIE